MTFNFADFFKGLGDALWSNFHLDGFGSLFADLNGFLSGFAGLIAQLKKLGSN